MCTSATEPGQALLKREEEERRFFAFTSYLVLLSFLFWDSNPTKDS